jgi:pyruvate kinase
MSFVRHEQDVHELQRHLRKLNGDHLGIVLKIETRQAFERLPNLIMAAMRHHPVGIMIARGDLAVECGYERLAEVQEEMLWICEAAHLPVIWATEVLKSLAKKGQPSRAEITDAAMGERAECVMLNKGHTLSQRSARLITSFAACKVINRRSRHDCGGSISAQSGNRKKEGPISIPSPRPR